MEDIRKRCEDVLVGFVSKKQGNTFLADLSFAQFYKLEKLLRTIVNRARQLKLSEFKVIPLLLFTFNSGRREGWAEFGRVCAVELCVYAVEL